MRPGPKQRGHVPPHTPPTGPEATRVYTMTLPNGLVIETIGAPIDAPRAPLPDTRKRPGK